MKVSVEGSLTTINLTDDDFIHAGGEGSVYVKGDTAFKIYHDPKKMIEIGRIQELQKIDCANVIKPEKTIYDTKGKPIGYTMKALNDVWALTRLFNKTFRTSNNVSDEVVKSLIQRMRDTYERLHELGFLVADGNELNFLVSQDFKEIYFIDVDAFKTPSFPSRAYNESTLDPNLTLPNLDFTEASDWFAYAVVACQMLTGIHPFKGIYTGNVYSFAKNDIPERIKKRISVFNADVRMSRPLMELADIPKNYRDWFSSMFETKNRNRPPELFNQFSSAQKIVAKIVSKSLNVSPVLSAGAVISGAYTNGSLIALKTDKFFEKDGIKYPFSDPKSEIIMLPVSNTVIMLKRDGKNLVVYNPVSKEIKTEALDLKDIFVFSNRAYGISGTALLEITFSETPKGLKVFTDIIENLVPGTAKSFDGLIIEKLMGGTHASLPISQGECAKLHLKEYDSKHIINAKYSNKVLVVVWYDKGNYIKDVYKLNNMHREMKLIYSDNVDSMDINMTVLENGIAVSLEESGNLRLFSTQYKSDIEINDINASDLPDDIRLFSVGVSLHGFVGDQVYSLKMK